MKGWKKCPHCWGTGFVGGFQAPCDHHDKDMASLIVSQIIKRQMDEIMKTVGSRAWLDWMRSRRVNTKRR